MSATSPAFRAGGSISPSRFVKLDTTNERHVEQATANDKIIGISQKWTKAAPVSGASALAAAANDPITVHGMGEICLLECGGTVTVDDRLKSDANGKGVTITGVAQHEMGARALEDGASGELIRVQVSSQVIDIDS